MCILLNYVIGNTVAPRCEGSAAQIYLRPLREDDLDYLYRWENEPEVWQYGDCGVGEEMPGHAHAPRFSRDELRRFIENQQHGFHANEQLRLVICRREGASPVSAPPDSRLGFIDLFDFDPVRLVASIGILICDPACRRRGYGSQALTLALDYARRELGLKEISCTVGHGNPDSEALFTGAGFRAVPAWSSQLSPRKELRFVSLS